MAELDVVEEEVEERGFRRPAKVPFRGNVCAEVMDGASGDR